MTHYRTADIDGLSIFYREAGDPRLPTILLLHGFPASSFMYRELIDRLADRFHVIAPDYPGFGHSAAPSHTEFDYTFDRLADVVDGLVDHLDLPSYALYMQDFGGPVGFRVATRRPERVSFLVVQNANAYEEGLPDSFWGAIRDLWHDPSGTNRAKIAEAGMSPAALEWNYTHGVADVERISPDSRLLQEALLNRPGNKDAMLDLLYDYRTNPALYPEWQEYLRTSRPPTLLVWGKNDVVFPESGAHPFKRDLPDVDFNLLDTGHFALEDHCEQIAAHIRRFAAALPG
ncbi:alpha/beta fold hydrolase [Pseudonocardia sp. TRM90224]|uniref:alpha/beta fold hydrolase n=1 Tax=Pseudonocardia sp. TRM90224 TaxID=2812678 RepID=UPI001E51322F|nr:alpha/beta fold hydrolase [Pseudonocardia sp. TRM90224]